MNLLDDSRLLPPAPGVDEDLQLAGVDPNQRANGTAGSIVGLVADDVNNRWNYRKPLGTPVVVTYGFWSTVPANAEPNPQGDPRTTFQPFDESMKAATRDILAKYAQAIGITFVETDLSVNARPMMLFGRHAMDDAGGYADYPVLTFQGEVIGHAGEIFIRSDYTDFSAGGFAYKTLAHEIGHGLGLKHPFTGDTAHQLQSQYDNLYWTVMTYNSTATANGTMVFDARVSAGSGQILAYGLYHVGPALYDIEALRYLYGPSQAAAADDVFRFDNTPVFTTIVDSGGQDTIDASAATLASTIDLQEGAFSSIAVRSVAEYAAVLGAAAGANAAQTAEIQQKIATYGSAAYTGTNNVSIAQGSVIEDAIGGSGNDRLFGNAADNDLRGNAGNDELDGRGGFDTAVYAGNRASFQFVRAADGSLTVSTGGGEGSDHLVSIEALQFADKTLFAVTGQDATVARLYGAAFGRAPDPGGLGVQLGALHAGVSVQQLSANFIGSAEFRTRYGTDVSNTTFATALYSNVLGRAPDPGGLAVQVGALDGGLSRVQLLLNFADSGENVARVSADWLLA